MSISDAKIHLAEAANYLTLEAYKGDDMQSDPNVTLAQELERIDKALGPKGNSLLYPMAVSIRAAFIEIRAARQALESIK